jgi:hypothetical protein
MKRFLSWLGAAIALVASLTGIYSFMYAYPKVDAYSGGVNAPFEFMISDPSYLCFYDVKPSCAHIDLKFATTTNPFRLGGILLPYVGSICPGQPRRFSCGIAGTPALLPGSQATIVLDYSVHFLPFIPFPKWPSKWDIPCTLGNNATWFCGEPM